MKPFTKEMFEAVRALMQACDRILNNKDFVDAHQGKPAYTYDPKKYMLVPHMWGIEQSRAVAAAAHQNKNMSYGDSTLDSDIHHAITKVFGGEK